MYSRVCMSLRLGGTVHDLPPAQARPLKVDPRAQTITFLCATAAKVRRPQGSGVPVSTSINSGSFLQGGEDCSLSSPLAAPPKPPSTVTSPLPAARSLPCQFRVSAARVQGHADLWVIRNLQPRCNTQQAVGRTRPWQHCLSHTCDAMAAASSHRSGSSLPKKTAAMLTQGSAGAASVRLYHAVLHMHVALYRNCSALHRPVRSCCRPVRGAWERAQRRAQRYQAEVGERQ